VQLLDSNGAPRSTDGTRCPLGVEERIASDMASLESIVLGRLAIQDETIDQLHDSVRALEAAGVARQGRIDELEDFVSSFGSLCKVMVGLAGRLTSE
jgi:hypothetical protein